MKSLLVLYPIYPYAYALIGFQEPYEVKKRYGRIYSNLIRRRYPDFKIVWMMFSDEYSPKKPDMYRVWEGIKIKEDDIVGACGVSFDEHCDRRIYPKAEHIISACPQPIEKLVICGFHFWDCVARVAKYAHEQGIDVLVDDDLTEFFFWRAKRRGVLSISNFSSSLEEGLEREREQYINSGRYQDLKRIRKARMGKPWLAPI